MTLLLPRKTVEQVSVLKSVGELACWLLDNFKRDMMKIFKGLCLGILESRWGATLDGVVELVFVRSGSLLRGSIAELGDLDLDGKYIKEERKYRNWVQPFFGMIMFGAGKMSNTSFVVFGGNQQGVRSCMGYKGFIDCDS